MTLPPCNTDTDTERRGWLKAHLWYDHGQAPIVQAKPPRRKPVKKLVVLACPNDTLCALAWASVILGDGAGWPVHKSPLPTVAEKRLAIVNFLTLAGCG